MEGLAREASQKMEADVLATAAALTESFTPDRENNVFKSGTLFFILTLIYLVAAQVNHIDDTDETYGYWEPLHYLLYGTGMQTWEYAPDFAIRSYAFIAPYYCISYCLKFMGIKKLHVFITIKAILGIFTAYSASKLIFNISKTYGQFTSILTCVLIISSPGIFYASTSFLPSAVAMSLVMQAASHLLQGNHLMTIFWGSVAVLWTGWPFVGLIFAPFGIYILYKEIFPTRRDAKIVDFCLFCIKAVCIVFGTGACSAAIDFIMYGKITSPSFNILMYNAGGNGDILYGVEDWTYYAKNLVLTTVLGFPLSLLFPIAVLFKRNFDPKYLVIPSSAFLWAAVLFSRPHKEERFMYPILPLLAVTGAFSVNSMSKAFASLLFKSSDITIERDSANDLSEVRSNASETDIAATGASPARTKKADLSKKRQNIVLMLVLTILIVFSVIPGVSRVYSNYINFGGYLDLWSRSSQFIPNNIPQIGSRKAPAITMKVCMGGDWYTFPSHFFLPANARLEYYGDDFHGILPQHFAANNGTSATPLKAFNGLNQEEKDRYVPISECDYIFTRKLFPSDFEGLRIIDSTNIIDPSLSSNALARAFFVPNHSQLKNVYMKYNLYKNERKASESGEEGR